MLSVIIAENEIIDTLKVDIIFIGVENIFLNKTLTVSNQE